VGQKVNPISFHLGITRGWDARWYCGKDYADTLHEDLAIRDRIKKRFYYVGVF